MTYPLTGNENRHFEMKRHHNLFKRRRVLMTKQIIDKSTVLRNSLCALTVGNTCRLDNPLIPAEIVDKPYKSLVKNRLLFIQNSFRFRNNTMCHDQTPYFDLVSLPLSAGLSTGAVLSSTTSTFSTSIGRFFHWYRRYTALTIIITTPNMRTSVRPI